MHWHVIEGILYESEGTAPDCPANTAELAVNQAIAYPNPTSNILHVTLTDQAMIDRGSLDVRVCDNVGRELLVTSRVSGNELEVNCSALPDGLYQIIYNQGGSMIRF